MKKRFLFIIVMLLAAHGALAQNDFCTARNTSFAEGEHLYFKVWYNSGPFWIGAGEASFNVALEQLAGRSVYHVTGDGKTLHSYEWFYKVRDRYESFIDAATMLPLKFVRNVSEGSFRFLNDVSFNQGAGQATSTHGTFTVPHCVQDVLSSIYYARNIDYNNFRPGDKIPFTMFLDDKVYNLYIRYLGKEKITTRYGTFNAIKISPLLIEGTIFKGGEKMTVWVSDDQNHLPVRVDSPILIGSVKVDLMAFDHLRNPLSGLVKR